MGENGGFKIKLRWNLSSPWNRTFKCSNMNQENTGTEYITVILYAS